ncbi:MAG: hypothetical protein ABFS28_01295 [Bacteroidota bacterium]
MERDPNISKLVRESGISRAPENLTGRVMDLISEEAEKKTYKPLIGKWGRMGIILFIVGIVAASFVWTEPGQGLFKLSGRLSGFEMQLPQIQINLEFLSQINLSTGVVSALVALFILVLSDAGLRRKKLA